MEQTEALADVDSSTAVGGNSCAPGQQPSQLNSLHQPIQGYTSDSEEEEAAISDQPTAPSAPENTDSCSVSRILGFISFMFTYDDPPHDDREVLYIYEIHLDEQLRGQRLGPYLMTFVENVARACQIKKTMLTVFTANKRAKGIYESLGYGKDECSPDDRVTRNKVIKADYVIMSKSID
jgi:ribosomal protein S18 acetylase RimI-like enzyme